jgi:glycerophosphoryl diester phosphodiesterase
MELANGWMNQLTHEIGMFVHVYTVDNLSDRKRLDKAGVDGFFTNRPDVLLGFYGRKTKSVEDVLKANRF